MSRRFEPLMKAAEAKHAFEVVRFLTDAASVGDAVARRAAELRPRSSRSRGTRKEKLRSGCWGA